MNEMIKELIVGINIILSLVILMFFSYMGIGMVIGSSFSLILNIFLLALLTMNGGK